MAEPPLRRTRAMHAAPFGEEFAPADAAAAGWHAHLGLRFERVGARTLLAARRHTGPLRVQKPLSPEGPGVCQVVVVHPPGGIVAGDSLAIEMDACEGAHVQVTTPGASKWYRSAGRFARSETRLRARAGAVIEWLPQETLIYDGARSSIGLSVELVAGAKFIGWDVTVLGRTASDERFDSGLLRQRLEVRRDGEMLWCERALLDGGSRALQSAAILDGAPVFGTLVTAAGSATDDLLAACRDVRCQRGEGALTRLPGVLVGRYRGDSASAARTYFATLWQLLRPVLVGCVAMPPRIWNT